MRRPYRKMKARQEITGKYRACGKNLTHHYFHSVFTESGNRAPMTYTDPLNMHAARLAYPFALVLTTGNIMCHVIPRQVITETAAKEWLMLVLCDNHRQNQGLLLKNNKLCFAPSKKCKFYHLNVLFTQRSFHKANTYTNFRTGERRQICIHSRFFNPHGSAVKLHAQKFQRHSTRAHRLISHARIIRFKIAHR